MSLVIDLIIIAIILLFTFLGYKRGFIKVAINLCTFFIAIILAFALYKPISKLVIENTNIDESIQTTIINKFLPEDSAETAEVEMPDNLPNMILKKGQNTVISVAESFTTTLIEAACFLLIFVLSKIILKFVTVLADLIAKLPILKQFNELGGTIYGILEGLFIVFTLFAAISLAAPLIDESILDIINKTIIGSFIYNNNILLKLIL